MDKYLIIGANGLIGRKIGKFLEEKGEHWVGSCNKRPEAGLRQVDVTSGDQLEEFMSGTAPSVVFHCANLAGGVDLCERYSEKASAFHYDATINIGRLCRELDSKLVYISSDYVFPDSSRPIDENDEPGPLNEYGRLKLKSEEWVRKNMKDFLIIRTTNVYGWDPDSVTPNYVMNVFNTVSSGRSFIAPSYLWGTPTYVDDLAKAILGLVDRKESGVYHVVGPDFVNRFDWAIQICRSFRLDHLLVQRSDSKPENYIPRPLIARLNTAKLQKLSIVAMKGVVDGLESMKQEMEKQTHA